MKLSDFIPKLNEDAVPKLKHRPIAIKGNAWGKKHEAAKASKELVSQDSRSGTWYIEMGNPGYNSPTNNAGGYPTKERALQIIKHYSDLGKKSGKKAALAEKDSRSFAAYHVAGNYPAHPDPASQGINASKRDAARAANPKMNDKESRGYGEIWQTKSGKFGAKNHRGNVEYFKNKKDAHMFSQGAL